MTEPIYRVIASGWRDWPASHRDWIWLHLNETVAIPNGRRLVLAHGQCPYGGADLFAEQWAGHYGFEAERNPADFDRLGKAAGPQRNTRMIAKGGDLCVAFPGPGSRGTWDCVRKAADAGVNVEILSWALVLKLEAAGVRPEY